MTRISTTDIANHLPTFEELDIPEDFSIDNVNFDEIGDSHSNQVNPIGKLTSIAAGKSTLTAVALIRGKKAFGIVRLFQIGIGPTVVVGFIKGLKPFSLHGFHVHQYRADGGDCEQAGEHYNPTKQTHGSPESIVSHVGDLGNILADGLGIARFNIINPKMSLKGKFSVIQRALVVHERSDDLGMGYNHESKKSGNSGGRLGCGTIKFVSIG